MYVIGFAETIPNHTRTEIQFDAEKKNYIPVLSRRIKHMAIDGQVCFHRQPFSNLFIKHYLA